MPTFLCLFTLSLMLLLQITPAFQLRGQHLQQHLQYDPTGTSFNCNRVRNCKDKGIVKHRVPFSQPVYTLQAVATTHTDGLDDLGYYKAGYKSGFVTILGNPNVGKSSLLNAMLNQKLCIVSPKPQTTRHRINGIITEEDFQIIFSDTPGMISAPSYKLQEAMMESVSGAANDADVVVVVTDVYAEEMADKKAFQRLSLTDRPVIIAINKIDLSSPGEGDIDIHPILKLPKLDQNVHEESSSLKDTPQKKRSIKSRVLMNRKRRKYTKGQEGGGGGGGGGGEQPSKKIETDADMLSMTPEVDGNPKGLEERNENFGETDSLVMEYMNRIAEDEEVTTNTNSDSLSSSSIKNVQEVINLWQSRLPRAEIMTMTVLQNETGVSNLLERLVYHLPEGPKYFPDDEVTNRDERFFTSEIIRESLFLCYQDEVPYSCEVTIESFKDKSPSLSVIEANIWASKESQKAILIGRNGRKLKELGSAARGKLEEFLDRKVFLSLRVKIDSDWRQSDESLRKYGYKDSDFG